MDEELEQLTKTLIGNATIHLQKGAELKNLDLMNILDTRMYLSISFIYDLNFFRELAVKIFFSKDYFLSDCHMVKYKPKMISYYTN